MKEHIDDLVEFLKVTDVDGCITGSCLLGYFENQDVDVFLYSEGAFSKLLYCLFYNPKFLIIDPLEKWKFEEYTNKGNSSLNKLGLVSIKFKYNMCVDVNIIYKKSQRTIFDVLSAFDLDIITTGIDIKTQKTLSLRESTGNTALWNKWNKNYYSDSEWDVKRILRQFERCVKYHSRGFDVSNVVDKYLEIAQNILDKDQIFKTERGIEYYQKTQAQIKLVLEIINIWKETLEITEEQLTLLKEIV